MQIRHNKALHRTAIPLCSKAAGELAGVLGTVYLIRDFGSSCW